MTRNATKVNCSKCGIEFYSIGTNTCPNCRRLFLNERSSARFNRTGGKTYDQEEHIDRDTLSPLRVVRIERRYGVCDNGHGGRQDLIRTQATSNKFLCVWCRAYEVTDNMEH